MDAGTISAEAIAAQWAEKLSEVLAPVDALKARPGLAADLVSYVLSGAPSAVLDEVHGESLLANELNISQSVMLTHTPHHRIPTLYAQFDRLPHAVAWRWVQVINALTARRPHPWTLPMPAETQWVHYLFQHANWHSSHGRESRPALQDITFASLEPLLQMQGHGVATLLSAAFMEPIRAGYRAASQFLGLHGAHDFSDALLRHAEVLRPLLLTAAADRRPHILWFIARANARVHAAYADELRVLAASSSKKVSAAALPLLPRTRDLAEQPPKLPVIDWDAALPADIDALLQTLCQRLDDALARQCAAERAQDEAARAAAPTTAPRAWPLYADGLVAPLKHWLQTPPTATTQAPFTGPLLWHPARLVLEDLLNSDARLRALAPVHMARLLGFFGMLATLHRRAFHALHATTGQPSLLELQAIGEPLGLSAAALMYSWAEGLGAGWDTAEVAPFLTHNLPQVQQLQSPSATLPWGLSREAFYQRLTASFDRLPDEVVDIAFQHALAAPKTERLITQRVLADLPQTPARTIAALKDSKAEVRQQAAQWLRKLRHGPAVPALEQAVTMEKNDMAKGAMLDALEALGQAISRYLSTDKLAADAAKGLAKGLPAELEWMPWDRLPAVRWAQADVQVQPAVLQWLLLQAFKLKTPEPHALLRKYASMLVLADRETLGVFVLKAWQDKDLASHMESAIASKGLLAVVAACPSAEAVTLAADYIKTHYGLRAAQGKALIAMLAWMEHPGATQYVLAINQRFRTKGFQEEAARQVDALAERRGWTLAELADRTIPDMGLDPQGRLALSFGARSFAAQLGTDFKLQLRDAAGKALAALPDPHSDDDADSAAQAKKTLSAARKAVKTLAQQQQDRLYEAFCTGREWRFDDWQSYLVGNPVVRQLVQRLVWVRMEDGQPTTTFRPLDDGTLSGPDDQQVTLPDDAQLRVAHDALLSLAQVTAWHQHLIDYETLPLFAQLGRGVWQPAAGDRQADRINAFEGHMLGSFKLRGRATQLGYTRGATEDGGYFYCYERRLPSLKLVARLRFSGSALPEQDRPVALEHLSLLRTGEQGDGTELCLGDVPQVLLSECFHDLRLIAAEGTGFDPQWRTRFGR